MVYTLAHDIHMYSSQFMLRNVLVYAIFFFCFLAHVFRFDDDDYDNEIDLTKCSIPLMDFFLFFSNQWTTSGVGDKKIQLIGYYQSNTFCVFLELSVCV